MCVCWCVCVVVCVCVCVCISRIPFLLGLILKYVVLLKALCITRTFNWSVLVFVCVCVCSAQSLCPCVVWMQPATDSGSQHSGGSSSQRCDNSQTVSLGTASQA